MIKKEMELKLSLNKFSPLAAAMSLALILPTMAQAADFVVNTTEENPKDNKTSINEAIRKLNLIPGGHHTLTFDASLSGKTLEATSTIYNYYASLTIDGSNAENLTLSFDAVNFEESSYTALYIYDSELTLSNINISVNNDNWVGLLELIDAEYSTVTLDNVIVDGNNSQTRLLDADESNVSINSVIAKNFDASANSAIDIDNDDVRDVSISINNSLITNNSTDNNYYGEAAVLIRNSVDFNEGEIYSNHMDLLISNTSITGNFNGSGWGAGLNIDVSTDDRFDVYEELWGLGGSSMNVLIENVTIAHNGFFDYNEGTDGAGLILTSYHSDMNIAVVNSTIAGNEADYSSALYVSAYGEFANLSLNVINSTIADNSSSDLTDESGSAVTFYSSHNGMDVNIANSIIANNERTVYNDSVDELVTLDSDIRVYPSEHGSTSNIQVNNSLIGVEDMGESLEIAKISRIEGSNNIFGQNPMLNSLADNGGTTQTMMPKSGSPVIDSGSKEFLAFADQLLNRDQRGSSRVVGGTPDMGAVEVCADGNCDYEGFFETKNGGLFGSLGLHFLPALFGFAWLRRRIK